MLIAVRSVHRSFQCFCNINSRNYGKKILKILQNWTKFLYFSFSAHFFTWKQHTNSILLSLSMYEIFWTKLPLSMVLFEILCKKLQFWHIFSDFFLLISSTRWNKFELPQYRFWTTYIFWKLGMSGFQKCQSHIIWLVATQKNQHSL